MLDRLVSPSPDPSPYSRILDPELNCLADLVPLLGNLGILLSPLESDAKWDEDSGLFIEQNRSIMFPVGGRGKDEGKQLTN